MTRRQIVTTLILIAAGSVVAAASQKPTVEESCAIRGAVRVGACVLSLIKKLHSSRRTRIGGKLIHVGQGNTANAELTIIRCRDVARVIIDFLF